MVGWGGGHQCGCGGGKGSAVCVWNFRVDLLLWRWWGMGLGDSEMWSAGVREFRERNMRGGGGEVEMVGIN